MTFEAFEVTACVWYQQPFFGNGRQPMSQFYPLVVVSPFQLQWTPNRVAQQKFSGCSQDVLAGDSRLAMTMSEIMQLLVDYWLAPLRACT